MSQFAVHLRAHISCQFRVGKCSIRVKCVKNPNNFSYLFLASICGIVRKNEATSINN